MAFKTATVNASDVPATLTNFPSYVDLDRLGVTTLAEAQSIRVYADEAKTVEWAREIVSVDEMHVKVPSFTSTVDIYVDWDGVRSDYVVTATYGAQNVWTEYEAVWHLNEDPGGVSPQMLDATGNGYDLEARGSMTSADLVDDHLGKAIELDGIDDYFSTPTSFNTYPATAGEIRYTSAIISDIPSNEDGGIVYFSAYNGFRVFDGGLLEHSLGDNSGTDTSASQVDDGNRYHVAAVFNQANEYRLYRNGVQVLQKNITDTEASNNEIWLGRHNAFGSGNYLDARISEVRWSRTDLGSDWATTEYNNQNAESTFWGTWTDVSTATTVTNIISIGNIVELNNISSIIGA